MLKKHKLRAIFFITGHFAEKLEKNPDLLEFLKGHEIGFHSSGHSVHPVIQEYTDVNSYEKAFLLSVSRETSHINPTTGEVEGYGGIRLLQDLFRPKKIEAFRAPGMSWSPPNLEALASLGIKYDFSSNLTYSEPVFYREITFYPYTYTQKWLGTAKSYMYLVNALLKRRIAVFDLHPSLCVNQRSWDSIYHNGNPRILSEVPKRPNQESASILSRFELLLKLIRDFKSLTPIETDPKLTSSSLYLRMKKTEVAKIYESSADWPKRFFGYIPQNILAHFYEFFEDAYT